MADPTAVVTLAEARRAGHSVQLESITHRFGANVPVEADRVVGPTRRIS